MEFCRRVTACFSDLVKPAAVLPGLQSISCRAGLAALYVPGVLANADEMIEWGSYFSCCGA
jgi:hypothetical protein